MTLNEANRKKFKKIFSKTVDLHKRVSLKKQRKRWKEIIESNNDELNIFTGDLYKLIDEVRIEIYKKIN